MHHIPSRQTDRTGLDGCRNVHTYIPTCLRTYRWVSCQTTTDMVRMDGQRSAAQAPSQRLVQLAERFVRRRPADATLPHPGLVSWLVRPGLGDGQDMERDACLLVDRG